MAYSHPTVEEKAGIDDKTETNLVNLRRVIYLTLQNSVRLALFLIGA